MWEWLSNLSSLSVFIAVGAMGFLFLLFSFLFGEFIDDVNIDDGADHDFGDGPSVFSLRTLAVFLAGLGGLGAIAELRGAGVVVSASVGLAGGVALAGMVYGFARYLYRQQSSSLVTLEELIGRRAEVTVAIPAGGPGQVRCLVGETMVEKIARARGDGAIPAGAAVRIEEVAGEMALVSPWESFETGRSLFSSPEPPELEDWMARDPKRESTKK
jgi:membrane protein implicated in regulation of membrane protease activity